MSLILIDIKIDSLYFLENQSGSMLDYNFARAMPEEKTIQFVSLIKSSFRNYPKELYFFLSLTNFTD